MRELTKYTLDFDKTWLYIEDQLTNVNTLSSQVLINIDFQKGNFFTLLPAGSNLENLYNFTWCILPQNPLMSNGNGGTYSIIPTVDDEMIDIIQTQLNKNLFCIFDSANSTYSKKCNNDTFCKCGGFYNDEVYYCVEKSIGSKDMLEYCLCSSNVIWHSLIILTTANTQFKGNEISLEMMKEICLKAKTIIVGAYDREAYIFWEKDD